MPHFETSLNFSTFSERGLTRFTFYDIFLPIRKSFLISSVTKGKLDYQENEKFVSNDREAFIIQLEFFKKP